MSDRVVVDACVGREAGETNAPRSKSSRLVLEAILRQGVFVDFSPEVDREWRKHASRISIMWQTRMIAKRRLNKVRDKPSALLRKHVRDLLGNPDDIAALNKDVHLLELALAYGSGIISSDDRSGRLSRIVAEGYRPLRRVQWVSPHDPEGSCLAWVAGTLADKEVGRLGDGG
ncbi:hypothetical protein GCM10022227_43900 [Streptomyces sedi]